MTPNALHQLFLRLLRGETDHAGIQLFRYAFVGGVAFAADFGALFLLTEVAGLHYLLSAALAFVLGLTVNYLVSIRWVFNNRKLDRRSAEFGIYAGIGLAGLGLNELILFLLTDLSGLHYLISKVVATGIVFLWNFGVRRYLLFSVRQR